MYVLILLKQRTERQTHEINFWVLQQVARQWIDRDCYTNAFAAVNQSVFTSRPRRIMGSKYF